MIKKEFMDIIKPFLVRLSPLVLVPLVYIFKIPTTYIYRIPFIFPLSFLKSTTDHDVVLLFIFLLGLITFLNANYLGVNIFAGEHRDKSFEYLLSFPFSKKRILFNKLVPRIVLLAAATAVYEILAFIYLVPLRSLQGSLYFFVDPLFFPLWVLFFFLGGVFVGLFEQKNWTAVVMAVTLIATGWFSIASGTVIRRMLPGTFQGFYLPGVSMGIGVLVILSILGIAFWSVYQRFDAKSMELHAKRYAVRVLPAMTILIAVSVAVLFS
jgi:ABC-type transport system involved in multi-copper enzyme maturation permease subunit